MADDDLYDPIFGGLVDDEVEAFRDAVTHLAAVLKTNPPLREAEVADVPLAFDIIDSDLAGADDALHRALAALGPKVAEAHQKADARRRRQEEENEAARWAATHGSQRLRLAIEAGVLPQSLGIYRDERLRTEHPGWMWVTAGDQSLLRKSAVNPSEEALRTLLDVKNTVAGARLVYDPEAKAQLVFAYIMGRLAWRPTSAGWDASHIPDTGGMLVAVDEVLYVPSVADAEEPF
ncbi:MAG: hypothetical protein JJE52_03120 [Acidimicrobiia bacterium]|nr:hypothetical protein [Acidimicrobiia bacterium]